MDRVAKPNVRCEVKHKGVLSQTASWSRVLEDGRVELEYFDFSTDAQDTFGNDVAWMYWVAASEAARIRELLGREAGRPIADDQAMLDEFAVRFADVKLLRDWLREQQIPFEEHFDSWA